MRRFIFFTCALFLFVFPAFAADETVTEPSVSADQTVVVPDVNVYIQDDHETLTYTGTTVYAVNPVTPENTSGLKSALLGILGNYDAVIVETQYETPSGETVVEHEVQVDYPWLCAALLLAITLYCLFRATGAALCRT